jgi:hypothetical protein
MKSENHMQNGDGMKKRLECIWCQWHRMHDSCGAIDTAYTIFAFENWSYLGEFEAEFKKESGAQGVLFDEKNQRSKISWHCPFNRSKHATL